jgi:uncharacterized protein YecE (DUF72 family)
MSKLYIGTCSWKYDSWRNIVYSDKEEINYLNEYSKHFNTVEIDQWFWSLFPWKKPVLPNPKIVSEYIRSVPKDFTFTIKVPNSLTLTHYYSKDDSYGLVKNPYFLSIELFEQFIQSISEMIDKTACLMFQFEYLNKSKMSSLSEFQTRFREFIETANFKVPKIGIELRNSNYLTESYFKFLNSLDLAHIFLEGYYMPSVVTLYQKFKNFIKSFTVIRLHGIDRGGIEKLSGGNWNKIYVNKDLDLKPIADMITELQSKNVDLYLNVNNHYEGSAPLTIRKIESLLQT